MRTNFSRNDGYMTVWCVRIRFVMTSSRLISILQRFLYNTAILFLVHALAHNGRYMVATLLAASCYGYHRPFQPTKTMTRHFVLAKGAANRRPFETPKHEGDEGAEEKRPYLPIRIWTSISIIRKKQKHTCLTIRVVNRRQKYIDQSLL